MLRKFIPGWVYTVCVVSCTRNWQYSVCLYVLTSFLVCRCMGSLDGVHVLGSRPRCHDRRCCWTKTKIDRDIETRLLTYWEWEWEEDA
jgi:hypothetical protein